MVPSRTSRRASNSCVVFRVQRIGLHAPIDDFRITLLMQFGLENGPIHLLSPDLGWLNLACSGLRTDRFSREG